MSTSDRGARRAPWTARFLADGSIWDRLMNGFAWYRKMAGGHWELWHFEFTNGRLWFRMDACSTGGDRPHYGCRGTPLCEDNGTPRRELKGRKNDG